MEEHESSTYTQQNCVSRLHASVKLRDQLGYVFDTEEESAAIMATIATDALRAHAGQSSLRPNAWPAKTCRFVARKMILLATSA